MSEFIGSLNWLGLIIGIVAALLIVEVLFRGLTNRFATRSYPHRTGSQLPRVLKRR